MQRCLRLLFGYVLAIGLFVLASQSFQRSLADLYSNQIDDLLDKPSKKDLARIGRALFRTIEVDPENPIHHDLLTQWYLLKVSDIEGHTTEARDLIDKGIQEARIGIKRRPAWPMTWARLLIWKAAFDKPDAEFRLALERVTTLGPWEAHLHRIVVESTLPLWNDLTPDDRQRVLQAATHGLRQKPQSMLTLVRSFGKMKEVCAAISPVDELFAKYCRTD